MTTFEFVIQGPPGAPVNAKEHNPKRYKRWINAIRITASDRWPADREPIISGTISVSTTNFYLVTRDRPHPPDVDNLLKPILDGMNGVVYQDDGQVYRVISDRFDLAQLVLSPSPALAEGLARYQELLHIRVSWEIEE